MKTMVALVLASLFLLPAAWAADAAHRLGAGANYWVAIDDIDIDDIDDNGLSYYASYQYRPTLIGIEADVEFLPDMFGKDAIAPAAYFVLGKAIYAAAGIGIINFDGEWADDPFYSFKAGLDLEVLPSLFLDISACYRFNSQFDFEDSMHKIDTDTVFLGAAARIGF